MTYSTSTTIQGRVGPAGPMSDGNISAPRLGQDTQLLMNELHPRYMEQTVRNNRFYAATQAVATTTVGLATIYTGLALSNPVGSSVNLVLDLVTVMQSVIQATQVEAYAIATGFNATTNVTHTTPLVTHPCRVGSGAAAQGLADISATLPTAPFYTAFLTDTAAASTDSPGVIADLQGSIILAPGAYACFVTPAQASVAGLWFSFAWSEVPLLK